MLDFYLATSMMDFNVSPNTEMFYSTTGMADFYLAESFDGGVFGSAKSSSSISESSSSSGPPLLGCDSDLICPQPSVECTWTDCTCGYIPQENYIYPFTLSPSGCNSSPESKGATWDGRIPCPKASPTIDTLAISLCCCDGVWYAGGYPFCCAGVPTGLKTKGGIITGTHTVASRRWVDGVGWVPCSFVLKFNGG
jgi:hypothetical protein